MSDVTDQIRELLGQAYTKEGVRVWMTSPNSNLGGAIPLVLIWRGKEADVLREAKRVAGS